MIMGRLIRFLKRPGLERRLMTEAGLWMFFFRLLIWVVPFRYVETYLGTSIEPPAGSLTEAERERLLKLRWAVEAASRNVPWEATCLPQALVAKAMLRRRGFANTLYLGVAKDQTDARVKAHAWLRSGDLVVVGYQGVEEFNVLTTFTDGSPGEGPKGEIRSRREGRDG